MHLVVLRRSSLLVLAAVFTILTISLAIYSEQGLAASKEGLKIFWEIVFPSLLPFFVLSEILLGLGVVHFFGVLLEPLMRPVFNVPGAGAFALSMGLAAGYPMDAVITGKFRRNGLCTRIEGERLLAFTNTADPLFMFGAVAVGMFGYPELGVPIAIGHYLGAFSVGFIFRFYGRNEDYIHPDKKETRKKTGILKRAVHELYRARKEDGRSLGKLLGEAVKDSISTLLMIGGFIMVFSVSVRIMEEIGLIKILLPAIGSLLKVFGFQPELANSLLVGLLEIDLGTMAAAKTNAPLCQQVTIAGAIIAWSGLSVHGQVISVIQGTDIRVFPYLVARLLHAILAGFFTFLLLGPVKAGLRIFPTGSPLTSAGLLQRWYLTGTNFCLIVLLLVVISLLLRLFEKYRLLPEREEQSKKRPV